MFKSILKDYRAVGLIWIALVIACVVQVAVIKGTLFKGNCALDGIQANLYSICGAKEIFRTKQIHFQKNGKTGNLGNYIL